MKTDEILRILGIQDEAIDTLNYDERFKNCILNCKHKKENFNPNIRAEECKNNFKENK